MSGPWIKMSTNLDQTPEVIALAARLEADPHLIVGKLWALWSWADNHTIDGEPCAGAVAVPPGFVDRHTGTPGFAEALRLVGWLEFTPAGGFRLPNFDRHNGETAKARALSAKRVAAHKARAKSTDARGVTTAADVADTSGNGVSVTDALPRVEESRGEKKKEIPPRARAETPGPDREPEFDPAHVSPEREFDPNLDWFEAEQRFLELVFASPHVIHPNPRAIAYEYQATFRDRWSNDVWRQQLPEALERLQRVPPWNKHKFTLKTLLQPETVAQILDGQYDPRPKVKGGGNRDRRHLDNGAHPHDPTHTPRF